MLQIKETENLTTEYVWSLDCSPIKEVVTLGNIKMRSVFEVCIRSAG